MSFLKKIKRENKKRANKEFEKAINMYTNLPNGCTLCQKEFDKNNKEMLQTWNLTVKKAKGETNLYCPECWNMALDAIKKGFNDAYNLKDKGDE